MLINVSNGEIIDKITILEIKKEKIKDKDKLQNVETELTYLTPALKKIQIKYGCEELSKLTSSLKEVNQKLWGVEDLLRDYEEKKLFSGKFIDLARSVYITNDERSRIKKQINILTESVIVEEKSYKEYGEE